MKEKYFLRDYFMFNCQHLFHFIFRQIRCFENIDMEIYVSHTTAEQNLLEEMARNVASL